MKPITRKAARELSRAIPENLWTRGEDVPTEIEVCGYCHEQVDDYGSCDDASCSGHTVDYCEACSLAFEAGEDALDEDGACKKCAAAAAIETAA